MPWTIFFFFIAVVAVILGYLGLGYGPIGPFKVVFYISSFLLLLTFFLERKKKRRKYYE
jgi:uncharacterized membrane protein YtjA (UPF0391 family)